MAAEPPKLRVCTGEEEIGLSGLPSSNSDPNHGTAYDSDATIQLSTDVMDDDWDEFLEEA